MNLADYIIKYRTEHGISQRQLAAKCSLSTGYISLIEKEINPQTGKRMVPTLIVLNKLASGMGITIDELFSSCDDMPVDISTASTLPDNILPMPKMRKLPIIGTIACGTPITAVENYDGEADVPEDIDADFVLRCKGDSMINARIYDGDLCYIRRQPTVEHGQIAAVMIDDEATLKRVKLYEDHIVLEPENPQYKPFSYWGEDMNNVHILGLAVYFVGAVK